MVTIGGNYLLKRQLSLSLVQILCLLFIAVDNTSSQGSFTLHKRAIKARGERVVKTALVRNLEHWIEELPRLHIDDHCTVNLIIELRVKTMDAEINHLPRVTICRSGRM